MNTVIGIDPSLSATGVIVLDASGQILKKQIVSSAPSGGKVADRMKRIEGMVRTIKAVCDEFRPSALCLEHYTLGSNSPGTADRIEFGGLLRYALWSSGWCPIEVNQSSLKKWATGKGKFPPNSGKTPMIVAMTARYGIQLDTDDEYDAYALARMALQIAGFQEPTSLYQRECVDVAVNGRPKKAKKARAK